MSGASPNPESGNSRAIQGIATAAALILVPLLAVVGGDAFQAFIDFGAGVLSLLSLSGAVVWGLIATDRLLLAPRQRLVAQAIHRATAVAAIGFLLLHVSIKITLGKVALIGALLPFGLGITGTNGLIGFGSLAGLLMIVAGTTGALRSVFALPGKYAYKWRAIHMVAYPSWCFALIHGLFTGRPAATYVTVMYSLTVLGVAGVVALRLLPRQAQQRAAEAIVSMTGAVVERADSENKLRDLVSSPLPGGGVPPQREYQPRKQDPIATASFSAPLSSGRATPRLEAPSPPLYEATPAADPLAAGNPAAEAFNGSRGADGPSGAGSDRGQESGTGLSAGYRAMSMDATARMPAQSAGSPAPGGQGGEIPLAERIPMTEELPVITDDLSGPPGSWPAPSPPRPPQAFSQPPATPYDTGATPVYGGGQNPGQPGGQGQQPYDTGAVPQYNPGAAPQGQQPQPYDTGATPVYGGQNPGQPGGQGQQPYDTGAVPQYNPGAAPQGQQPQPYDTGATPRFEPGTAGGYGGGAPYGPDGASPYGNGPAPTYDTGSLPTYDTGSLPAYGTGAVPPYDTGANPVYGGGQNPGQQPGAPYDGADRGPVYPPPAGEPWNAPAGDRP
ncbi:hypothetical protein AB0O07_27385 [Streptomyces sp. NPDC093085]|uniref:hypothetical protein n=1 Tax=Streptomyces sp. NPDC093085 TaxID=3155068 RepID=UPI0034479896